MHHLVGGGDSTVGTKRRLPREQLEEQHTRREKVASTVNRAFTGSLLGGKVVRRAEHDPRARARRGIARRENLGDAEVKQLHVHRGVGSLPMQEDVLGLEIPMDNARFMGRSQGFEHAQSDGHDRLDPHPPDASKRGPRTRRADTPSRCRARSRQCPHQ